MFGHDAYAEFRLSPPRDIVFALQQTSDMRQEWRFSGVATNRPFELQSSSSASGELVQHVAHFKRIEVPLADLQAERDANLWSEAGY